MFSKSLGEEDRCGHHEILFFIKVEICGTGTEQESKKLEHIENSDASIPHSGTNEKEHCGSNPHVIQIFKRSAVKHLLCLILSLSHVLSQITY